MQKKILIISNSFPNYGGQSTTAYNLLKLLKNAGILTKLIYINYSKQSNVDPDAVGSSHKIALRKSWAYSVYHWYKKKYKVGPDSRVYKSLAKIKNTYFSLLLLPKLLYFLYINKFWPDIVITNIPTYYDIIKLVFKPKKILIIIGSSPEMYELSKYGIDAMQVITNGKTILGKIKNYKYTNFSNTNLIFNSQLTQQIYHALNIKVGHFSIQYFNLVPKNSLRQNKFENRLNDIVFIASNFDRNIKNIPLAYAIFEKFNNHKKIAIGLGSEMFGQIPNTTVIQQLSQKEIIDILSNTRLIIITSFFDSSPSILTEAILNGCNVLVSKNVGWHEKINPASVVNDFSNLSEWITKGNYLIRNKVSNIDFEEILSNSEQNIVDSITKFTERK